MKIFLTPPNEIDSLWSEVAPLIDKAFDHTQHDIDADGVKEALKNSGMFLWIVIDNIDIESILICSLLDYQRTRTCYIDAWSTKSGHEFNKYYQFTLDEIENFAKINGCDFLESRVRKGLAKKLTKHGWKDTHSWITKSLL